ncbi:MAG: acyltransferase domain-containing protein [Armatimonadota bacterium]
MSAQFDDIMIALGFDDTPDGWREEWEEAQAAFPGNVPFLAEGFIAEACRFSAFPADIEQELQRAAAVFRGNPDLSRTAWFLYRLYHRDPMPTSAEVFNWPFVRNVLAEPYAMIPALVLLAGVPRMRAMHGERGIPEEVTRATLRDVEIWMRHFHRSYGYWGLMNMGWPTHHFAGRLYRLGRLQFMHVPYNGPARAFLHRETSRVVALWGGEAKVRRDGYLDGTNDIFDEEARVLEFRMGDDLAEGHLINPLGLVTAQRVMLPLAEWRPALLPGAPVIDIHIPEDGKMDFDACGESLRQAQAFFLQHFPERPPAVAFVCGTWFFDAQYQQLLPPESNIVRFQREFYLNPLLSYDREPFWRVFGEMPEDQAAAPRDTALRRAMLEFKASGGLLRSAGGFCLIEGMEWGSRRYQREE